MPGPSPQGRSDPSSAVPSGSVIETPESEKRTAAAPERAGRSFALVLATAGGLGYAPVAPGTCGSALGVAVFLAFQQLPAAVYALSVLALLALGVSAADAAEAAFGRKDDRRIVIDEVVGQLVALFPLLLLPGHVVGGGALGLWLVTGFVAFRLFDIWKPGPVGWAERRFTGGAGVMADDVVAGALAALLLAAGLWLWASAGPTLLAGGESLA